MVEAIENDAEPLVVADGVFPFKFWIVKHESEPAAVFIPAPEVLISPQSCDTELHEKIIFPTTEHDVPLAEHDTVEGIVQPHEMTTKMPKRRSSISLK